MLHLTEEFALSAFQRDDIRPGGKAAYPCDYFCEPRPRGSCFAMGRFAAPVPGEDSVEIPMNLDTNAPACVSARDACNLLLAAASNGRGKEPVPADHVWWAAVTIGDKTVLVGDPNDLVMPVCGDKFGLAVLDTASVRFA